MIEAPTERHNLIKAGGIADHIHLLINQARDASVSDLVRDIKSNSSKWIHEEFPLLQHFSWQQGYAAFSVSKSGLGSLGTYIDNQIEHHRTRTFQEELRINWISMRWNTTSGICGIKDALSGLTKSMSSLQGLPPLAKVVAPLEPAPRFHKRVVAFQIAARF